MQVLVQAINNDDELFIALGAFALAYCLLLGGNGAVVATADLRGLVRMATTAVGALETYNMSTAVLGVVVRFMAVSLKELIGFRASINRQMAWC